MILSAVGQILFKATRFHDDITNDFKQFVECVENNYPNFSAGRFFNISLATLLTTASTILTFTIVLVQFHDEKVNDDGCINDFSSEVRNRSVFAASKYKYTRFD